MSFATAPFRARLQPELVDPVPVPPPPFLCRRQVVPARPWLVVAEHRRIYGGHELADQVREAKSCGVRKRHENYEDQYEDRAFVTTCYHHVGDGAEVQNCK